MLKYMFLFIYNIYNIYKSKVFFCTKIRCVNYNCTYVCTYMSHNIRMIKLEY